MECEFKFIQQWRAKLLFHIEQQLNISKTLRSAFPDHRTTASAFLYPGIGIYESAGSFYFSRYVFLYSSRIASGTRLPPVAHAMCVAFFIFSSR